VNKIDRREFLAYSSAFATAACMPACAQTNDAMRTREIPGTGEFLPVSGLGGSPVFAKLPPEGMDLPISLVQSMMDLGGRVIDTPAFIRPDVPVLGEVLTEMNVQDELFLISKITVNGKQEGIAHLEKLVAALGKRPIDLLLVHNMRDLENNWATLKDWKEAGRVRYIGVSLAGNRAYNNYVTNAGLEIFMKAEKPDFIMVPYSIHMPESGERILPLAMDLGTAVLAIEVFKTGTDGGYFDIVGGKELPDWTADFDCESWAQYSLKYALAHPAVTCVLTETSKAKHVVDNMRAGYGRLPDEAMREKMKTHLLSL
jgi:diketogulonate reductase-like aldo/keto reductase